MTPPDRDRRFRWAKFCLLSGGFLLVVVGLAAVQRGLQVENSCVISSGAFPFGQALSASATYLCRTSPYVVLGGGLAFLVGGVLGIAGVIKR